MKKLVLGVTIGGSSRLLDGQAAHFKDLGYEVYLISEAHLKSELFCQKEGCTHLPVKIDKEINPFQDLITLMQIIRHFRKVKPDIINVGTAKMGLLGTLGAYLCGINNRIYTCRGLRFETEKGLKKRLLIWMEKLTVFLSKKVIYVSPSLMKASERNGTCDKIKSIVIGKGSSNGVNIQFFKAENIDPIKRQKLISTYQLKGKIVIGYMGRVSEHKGTYELVSAFENIQQNYPQAILMMIGHIDCDKAFEERFRKNPSIIHVPFQDDVPLFMSLFEIFVLPSWREGFPNVPIQAASMGIPVIVSDATGCLDSVKDGYNGLVFKVRSEEKLANSFKYLLDNPDERKRLGKNGVEYSKNFSNQTIWNGIEAVYKSFAPLKGSIKQQSPSKTAQI